MLASSSVALAGSAAQPGAVSKHAMIAAHSFGREFMSHFSVVQIRPKATRTTGARVGANDERGRDCVDGTGARRHPNPAERNQTPNAIRATTKSRSF